ncbi:MAG: FkbM family methyltransferase [Hylemonella sp.]
MIKPAIKILRRRRGDPTFWTMPHDPICREMLVNGFYERDLLEKMCSLGANPSGVVLDIGANIGNHTIYFSRVYSKVISFEPSRSNCWILKANLHLNRVSNVVLVEKAVGDKAGYACLSNDNPQDTNNSLLNSTFQLAAAGDNQVEIVVGDEVLAQMREELPVSLIKIDVEGNEAKVIQGLQQTIRQHKPLVFWEAFTLDKVNESRALLDEMGYRHFYHVTARRYSSRWANKIARIADRRAVLKSLDDCSTFEGMNLASPVALKA